MTFKCKCAAAGLALALLLGVSDLVPANAAGEGEVAAYNVPVLLRMEDAEGIKNARNSACELGSVAADAARAASGADIAVLAGGDFARNLQPGLRTMEEIQLSLTADRTLVTGTISVSELWAFMEAGVSRMVLDEQLGMDYVQSDFDGFPQISGFKVVYDMSAPVGERVYAITLENGETLDKADAQRRLTICTTADLLSGGYGYPILKGSWQELQDSLSGALAEYIAEYGADIRTTGLSARVTAIGCADYTLLSSQPQTAVLILAALILLTLILGARQKTRAG